MRDDQEQAPVAAEEIVKAKGLSQISDSGQIADTIAGLLADHPDEVQQYREGKESLENWFFGQIMRLTKGQANPQVVKVEMQKQLAADR